ncbi:MAG: glycosyltransferase family 2 protein [Gammaproteobacteria bacterium]|nr:glycosyltransferase family 2 protein [Gammaproteobacteria bacterium]
MVKKLDGLDSRRSSISEVSIVLPAKNEAANIGAVIESIRMTLPEATVLVVDDGSTDDTRVVAEQAGAYVVSHPYSMGNGAAVKTGARQANSDILVFMDADGQHDARDIPRLLGKLAEGHEMVVGARKANSHASLGRRWANAVYNKLASLITGYRVEDLTSGFRAVRARHFRKFLYLMPNGFSYPTTSTMAFFRSGFPVAYVPIQAKQRMGKSHIRLFRDGARFFIIILKIGALFSPMRFFLPLSFLFFIIGVFYYGYTFYTTSRFTNMSALLFIYSLSIFLIGLISEQISALHYKDVEDDQRRIRRD